MSDGITIVFELGSKVIRLGFAGELSPRAVHTISQNDDMWNLDCVFDTEKVISKNNRKLYLMENMTKLLQSVIVYTSKTKAVRVLVIEKIFASHVDVLRSELTDIFLNYMKFHSISFQKDLFLPFLTVPRFYLKSPNGLLIDIGFKETRILPFYESRAVEECLVVCPIGIWHLLQELKRFLNQVGVKYVSKYVQALVGKYLSINRAGIETNCKIGACSVTSNTEINVKDINKLCYEMFVRNEIQCDVSESIIHCIKSCNVDVRSRLHHNVLFVGGGSTIPGLPEAICQEVNARLNAEFSSNGRRRHDIKPCNITTTNSNLSWLGGSIFSSIKANDASFICNQVQG